MAVFGKGFGARIDLPIVPGGMTRSDALDVMVKAHRAAVIVKDHDLYYLHQARAVIEAPRAIAPRIAPGTALTEVIAATNAPYLAAIDAVPRTLWPQLRPEWEVLKRHGVVQTIPSSNLAIGGLITETHPGVGWIVTAQSFSPRQMRIVIAKCRCAGDGGHNILAEEVNDGKCPYHDLEVDCS